MRLIILKNHIIRQDNYFHNVICIMDILTNNTISGTKIYPFVMDMDNNIDIDEEKYIPL